MKRVGVIVLGVAALTSSCVPWTVRPIEQEKPTAGDPAAYVESIWASRLVPAILSRAVDARTWLDAPSAQRQQYGRHDPSGPWQYMVRGTGRVVAVDTSSRSRLLLVDVAPYDHNPDVSIQIGPVLVGTALRDATGLIEFTNFENQLQFADVGNELNNRVLHSVLASLDTTALVGKTVSFAGAFTAEGTASPPIHGLVPVQLEVKP